MTWKELEFIFNRALGFTFSRRKICFTTAVLVSCGMLIVLCRALAAKAGDYVTLSLTFLPIFFCSAVLLALGILLIRIYHHEVKKLPVSYSRTLSASKDLLMEVAYLSIPLVLVYLGLWTSMGIFYLLKGIPIIGNALGVIFSFGPFLLLLVFFLVCFVSILILFFLTPTISLKSEVRTEVVEKGWKRLKHNPFSNLFLLFLGLVPLLFVTALMVLAAFLTGRNYFEAEKAIEVGFQWFVMMIPFCALLAPAVIFFFNFAVECHVLMFKKMLREESGAS